MVTDFSENFKNDTMDENSIGVYKLIQTDFFDCNSGPQYYQQIRNLWAAVLEQAIYDLKRTHTKKAAREWFYADTNSEISSFIWICKVLNVLPNKTRELIISHAF